MSCQVTTLRQQIEGYKEQIEALKMSVRLAKERLNVEKLAVGLSKSKLSAELLRTELCHERIAALEAALVDIWLFNGDQATTAVIREVMPDIEQHPRLLG